MNKNNIPHHVAIIMDGNRRWAKKRGLPAFKGHERGAERFKEIAKACDDLGVKILTVFAFSTENWKRSKLEVDFLMNLLFKILKEEAKFFKKNNIKFNVIGQVERLPKKVKELALSVMEETRNNKKGIVNIAISYGGRQEILDAAKKITKEKIEPEKINEKVFSEHLYTEGQPDVDLLIRTSGEMRLSGFLPWQAVYAELYFLPKMWPEFTKQDLKKAIKEYQRRQRRFGR